MTRRCAEQVEYAKTPSIHQWTAGCRDTGQRGLAPHPAPPTGVFGSPARANTPRWVFRMGRASHDDCQLPSRRRCARAGGGWRATTAPRRTRRTLACCDSQVRGDTLLAPHQAFAAPLRTDICPQRKEARPRCLTLGNPFNLNFLIRLCGLMVRRWRLFELFPYPI
jgi:hypothetical protein